MDVYIKETNSAEIKPLGVRFSFRYKLLIGFTLIFTVVFAVTYFWFYQYSTLVAKGRIREDLRDTLKAALSGISGDEFEALAREGKPDETGVPSQDERYWRHQDWLVTIHQIEPDAINVYSYIPGDQPDDVKWIGDDFRYFRRDIATKFLEPYTRGPDSLILKGFETETVNMSFYEDPWGEHVSAYGPIRNIKGEVVGAVGIDFSANYVRMVQTGIRDSMLLSFVIAYVALFILVYLLSSLVTNPITKLTQVAERVGEGDYDQDFSSLVSQRWSDEIDSLASSFSIMVGKVYYREQTLRRQVEELKIEVDETKRLRQVSEIVDTDFFRDLQSKANRMRARRSSLEEASAPEPSQA